MKLSIITVNLNNGRGLEQTIESLITQIYKEFEFILIDGGSTDNSLDIIRQKEELIDHWVSEKDRGIYHAMNKGIELAKGEYCLFLNSGDHLYSPESLDRAVRKGLEADLVTCELRINRFPYQIYIPKNTVTPYFFFTNSLPQPSTFIKRDLFEKVGRFNENYMIISDWEFFMLAMLEYEASYAYQDTILTNFEPGGISTRLKDLIWEERKHCLECHYKPFIQDYEELQRLRTHLFINHIEKYRKIFRKWLGCR